MWVRRAVPLQANLNLMARQPTKPSHQKNAGPRETDSGFMIEKPRRGAERYIRTTVAKPEQMHRKELM